MPQSKTSRDEQVALIAQLFANIPEGVVFANADRLIEHMNPAAEAMFGVANDRAVGRSTSILYADQGEFETQGKLRYNGEGQQSTPYTVSYARDDGSVFRAQTLGGGVKNSAGQTIGFLGIVTDIERDAKHIDAIHRLHLITTDRSLNFEGRMQAILTLGADHFGLPLGIQSRIEDEVYTVERCISPGDALQPGITFPLGDTYCSFVLAARGPVGFHHTATSEARTHPCYLTFQLEAYIGAPIMVDGERYGTLNFSRSEPTRPLSAYDMEMVRLLAQWAGHEIARQRDLEQLERVRAELARVAITDPLTGCANRRHAQTVLGQEHQRAHRYNNGVAVVMFDLDHFKNVNDTYGHAAGDAVLRAFVQVAEEGLRGCDLLARWGGEEFVCVLPETDEAGAKQVAERIRGSFAALDVLTPSGLVRATASAGVAVLQSGESADALLSRADDALYSAKDSGRDRVRVAKAS